MVTYRNKAKTAQLFHPTIERQAQMCISFSCRRQDAFSTVDLNPLVLTSADNTHRLVPADAKDLDPFSAHTLGIGLASFFQALARNRIDTLSHNTFLIRLGRPDIPDAARTVVATTDQAIFAVGITSQRNDGVGMAAQGHGRDGGCRRPRVDERDVTGRRTRGEQVMFGEVFEGKKRVGCRPRIDQGSSNKIPRAQRMIP